MADWLPSTPWRQGHALKSDDAKKFGLTHSNFPDDTVVVVISHDCDLASLPTTEPNVEVIVGREVDHPENNFLNGKSSRTLHLSFQAGNDDSVVVELSATQKSEIEKQKLVNCEPCSTALLTPKGRRILQRWLSARYARQAFPTEFVTRLDRLGIDARFKRIVAKAQKHISAVYFDLDRGELQDRELENEDECYRLSIYLVHPVDDDPEIARKQADVARASIEALFEERCKKDGRWYGIHFEGCYALATTDMTLEVADQLRKWHLDYISLAQTPDGPMTDKAAA